MIEELAAKWQAVRESALRERRGGARRRAAGAGPKQRMVFTDRLLVTLVHLRLGLPHAALAELYSVDRSTVSGAIRQVRPLLAARGFAVPDRPRVRLRSLEDLFAYADAEGVKLRIDGTEVQVRRPRAGRPGRKASSLARRSRTPSRPPPSATARDAPCSAESCGRAGCTTRLQHLRAVPSAPHGGG
ncbi:transposase family protein [Streptomyces sp. CB02959]|uniref:helix-turn-helix domain-containing protein n=1 Tax=Streptomyces sp. CB02959 TaxID=2020330 RepID=UPI0027E55439|nr:transposase family protein [Streptomyces sp. CB02959]